MLTECLRLASKMLLLVAVPLALGLLLLLGIVWHLCQRLSSASASRAVRWLLERYCGIHLRPSQVRTQLKCQAESPSPYGLRVVSNTANASSPLV